MASAEFGMIMQELQGLYLSANRFDTGLTAQIIDEDLLATDLSHLPEAEREGARRMVSNIYHALANRPE